MLAQTLCTPRKKKEPWALVKLDVSNNRITTSGASALLSTTCPLAAIHFRDNGINEGDPNQLKFPWASEDDAAVGLNRFAGKLLSNRSCTYLELSGNGIGDGGVKLLCTAIAGVKKYQNTTLKELVLSNNQIQDNGAAALAAAMKVNESLVSLNLNNNNIHDRGGRVLLEYMKSNKTLQELKLEGNYLSKDVFTSITRSAAQNSKWFNSHVLHSPPLTVVTSRRTEWKSEIKGQDPPQHGGRFSV
jgi:Leucine-rich repeat (LRR) protein